MKAAAARVLGVMTRAIPLALVLLAACSAPPRKARVDDVSMVDLNALRGVTQLFREYAAALLKLDSANPRDAEQGLRDLERIHPYCIYSDERAREENGKPVPGLIDEARKSPEARHELVRRGRIYTAMLTF